jgi:hypothetical protein
MVLHPHVYKKLQEEMDSVCGDQRLPTYEDRLDLPYLECVLKECLRLVLLLFLRSTNDVQKMERSCSSGNATPPDGRRCIPRFVPNRRLDCLSKHTVSSYRILVFFSPLIGVTFSSILHDCDKPTEFIPERYINYPDLPDPRGVVFGFGRR